MRSLGRVQGRGEREVCGRKPWRKLGPAPRRGPLWALAAPFLEVTWPPSSAAEASPAGSAVCAEPAEGSWVCGLEQVSPPRLLCCEDRTLSAGQLAPSVPELQKGPQEHTVQCCGFSRWQATCSLSPQGPGPPAQHQAQWEARSDRALGPAKGAWMQGRMSRWLPLQHTLTAPLSCPCPPGNGRGFSLPAGPLGLPQALALSTQAQLSRAA